MPPFLQSLFAALLAIREQGQRAVLSAVGVMVGSVAIVLLVSIAKGVQADIKGEIDQIGVNVLIVIPGRVEMGTFNPNLGGQSFLEPGDAERLRGVEGVVNAVPFTFVGGGIRNGEKVANPILAATEPEWFAMHRTELMAGRLLQDEDRNRPVALIGSVAKEQLFGPSEDAVGQKVMINGRPHTVVGVTKDSRQGQSLFSMGSFQNMVYVPYQYNRESTKNMQTDRIMIQIRSDVEPKTLIKNLDAVLEKRLDRQQFQVLTQEDLLGLVFKVVGILNWLLVGLTSISLFVAGIGIMTVMLMAVGERTREIGIRKTCGARNADVFWQFFFEAVVLALLGGLAGLALGYLVGVALAAFTPIKPMVTPDVVLLSLGTSLLVGVVFGLIPALRASRQDPVVSLRYE